MDNRTAIVAVIIIIVAIVAGVVGWSAKPSEDGGQQLPEGSQPFENIDITFIGGAAGDPFDQMLNRGARDASQALGFDLKYVHTNWSATEMTNRFRDAIVAQPDGIVVVGSPGYQALADLFSEAKSKGIIPYIACISVPKLVKEYRETGQVYGCAYDPGYNLGEAAAERLDLGEGDKAAVFSGSFGEGPGRQARPRGCVEALEDAGLTVDMVSHSPDVYGNPELGKPIVSGYYGDNPDVDLMVFDGGGTTAAAETYKEAIGKGPDEKPYIAGFDVTEPSIGAIEDGYIDVLLDQQQYQQGYLSCLNVCMTERYGHAGLDINTASGTIGPWNIEEMKSLIQKRFED